MTKLVCLTLFIGLISCGVDESFYATIDLRNDEILIDDIPFDADSIGLYLSEKSQNFNTIDKSKLVVKVLVDEKTTAGTVVDVKYQLRNIGILKIVYITKEEAGSSNF